MRTHTGLLRRMLSSLAVVLPTMLLTATAASALTMTLSLPTSGRGESVSYRLNGSSTVKTVTAAQFNAVLDGITGNTYCIDLQQSWGSGTKSYAPITLDSPQELRAAWLLSTHGPVAASAANRKTLITALQIAIWETWYDATPNLDTGMFILTSTTAAARSLAQAHLAGLPSTITPAMVAGIRGLSSATVQDMLFTPEPSTFVMMAIGLFGLARAGNRRTV